MRSDTRPLELQSYEPLRALLCRTIMMLVPVLLGAGTILLANTGSQGPGEYRIVAEDGVVSFPFDIYRGDIRFAAEINGHPVKLLLDDGFMWDPILFWGGPEVDALGLQGLRGFRCPPCSCGTAPVMEWLNDKSSTVYRLKKVVDCDWHAVVAWDEITDMRSNLADVIVEMPEFHLHIVDVDDIRIVPVALLLFDVKVPVRPFLGNFTVPVLETNYLCVAGEGGSGGIDKIFSNRRVLAGVNHLATGRDLRVSDECSF